MVELLDLFLKIWK